VPGTTVTGGPGGNWQTFLLPTRVIVTDPAADRAAILSLKHVTELRPAQSQPSA